VAAPAGPGCNGQDSRGREVVLDCNHRYFRIAQPEVVADVKQSTGRVSGLNYWSSIDVRSNCSFATVRVAPRSIGRRRIDSYRSVRHSTRSAPSASFGRMKPMKLPQIAGRVAIMMSRREPVTMLSYPDRVPARRLGRACCCAVGLPDESLLLTSVNWAALIE
jgi:hypothetical protein